MELYYLTVIGISVLSCCNAHTFNEEIEDYVCYTDDRADLYGVRECTECDDDYPSCAVTYLEIFEEYYNSRRGWGDNVNPEPLDVANNIHVSCWKDEVMRGGDRKKRTALSVNGDRSAFPSRRKRSNNDRFDNDALGLVYINRMYFGRTSDQSCDSMDTSRDGCQVNGFNEWDMEHFVDCNGAYDCTHAAIPTYLERCGLVSDYLHIDYQCIEERYNYYMEDEESTSDHSDRERSAYGYIMSPNYPLEYPNNKAVQCTLDLGARTGDFQFTALDFHLEDASHSHGCIYDWMEIQSFKNNMFRERVRFCGDYEPGAMTSINADYVIVKFKTDRDRRERGFWIKYEGFRQNGEETGVNVECSFYNPDEDYHYDNGDPDYPWHYYDYSTKDWWNWMSTETPDTDDGDDDRDDDDDDDDDENDSSDERAERRDSSDDGNGGLDSQTIIIIAASIAGIIVVVIVITVSVVLCRRSGGAPKKPAGLEAKTKAKPANSATNPKPENPYLTPTYSAQPHGAHTQPFDNPGYRSSPRDMGLPIRTGPLPSAPDSNEGVYEYIADSQYQPSKATSNHSNAHANPGYDSEVPIRTNPRTVTQGSALSKQTSNNPPVYSETYEDVRGSDFTRLPGTGVNRNGAQSKTHTYQNNSNQSIAYEALGSVAGVHTGAHDIDHAPSEHPYMSIIGDESTSNYYLQPVNH